MSVSVRPAAIEDVPALVELLLEDASRRTSLVPSLWPLAHDASARVEKALRSGLEGDGPPQELWRLAEAGGRIVGAAHAMIVPVPPIYAVATGSPGLFLDDCFITPQAPAGTAQTLLAATEDALRLAGAGSFIASCPAAGIWRPVYEARGYEAVTLYFEKHGFKDRPLQPGVRPAGPDDVPDIVRLSTDHRGNLAQLNPRFWPTHPDADSRFDAWMRFSLTLKDRDMFVAGPPHEVRGYFIAQPIGALLVPPAHDIAAIGVIDDFYDRDFANIPSLSNEGVSAAGLLSAAESAFGRRGFGAALAVCPAAWMSKALLLERQGYQAAKLWMLKR